MESVIMALSGFGFRFMVSTMFRIGLNVFLDRSEADTFQAGTAGTTFGTYHFG
jgi:hypothetical protein